MSLRVLIGVKSSKSRESYKSVSTRHLAEPEPEWATSSGSQIFLETGVYFVCRWFQRWCPVPVSSYPLWLGCPIPGPSYLLRVGCPVPGSRDLLWAGCRVGVGHGWLIPWGSQVRGGPAVDYIVLGWGCGPGKWVGNPRGALRAARIPGVSVDLDCGWRPLQSVCRPDCTGDATS